MSRPPLKRFENSSHLDESGPSHDLSREEARSFLDRLSFAQPRLTHINFSIFFAGTARILARAGIQSLLAAGRRGFHLSLVRPIHSG